MAETNPTLTPALDETAPAWAQQLFTKLDTIEQTQRSQGEALASLQESGHGLGEPDLAELANMDDEALDAAGYDVAAVREAVAQAIASGELTEGEPGGEAGVNAPANAGGLAGAPSSAAGAASAGTAMSAKAVQDIVALEIGKVRKQAREAAEAQEAEHAFAVIEEKVNALAAKNEELTTELATKDARIKALEQTLRSSGTRHAVAPGVESGVNFAAKETTPGTYEHVVKTEFDRLIKAGKSELEAKALAYQFGVQRHPGLYQEFRERGGRTVQLGS